LGCTTNQRSIQIWISPSAAGSGAPESLSPSFGISSIYIRNAEGLEEFGSESSQLNTLMD